MKKKAKLKCYKKAGSVTAAQDSINQKNKAFAVVVNDTLSSIRQLSLKSLVLRPLSGYTIEETANVRNLFESNA